MHRQIKWIAIIGLAVCGAVASAQNLPKAPPAGAPKAAPPASAKIAVRAEPDRTAIWVGDRLTYTVELVCQPGVDVLIDDLAPDKLKLDGLEVVGNTTERTVVGDTTTYRFKYALATYSVDAATAKIGTMPVRYYVKRAGQRLEDATPAGNVEVPATTIAIRSLLPDGLQSYLVRDDRPPLARSSQYTMLQSIGIGLVLISIAPALLFVITLVKFLRKRVRRSPRQVLEGEQSSLASVKSIDLNTVEGRREAYVRINALIRDHLRDICGVNAPNLTSAEVGPALTSHGKVPADLVGLVLKACEQALYAPVDLLPSAAACRETLKHAEQVIAAGR